MSKIVIEFDTVSKLATASIDGKSVENFAGVSVGRRYCCSYEDKEDEADKFSCYLEAEQKDEDADMTTRTLTYASQKAKDVVYNSEGPTPLNKSIGDYLSALRK